MRSGSLIPLKTEDSLDFASTSGLHRKTGKPVRLSPAEEAELLEAAEQIQSGAFVNGQELLAELRSRAIG